MKTVHFTDGSTLRVKYWLISDKKKWHFVYATEDGTPGEVGFSKVSHVEGL